MLNIKTPFERLRTLSPTERKAALSACVAAYHQVPSDDHFYLVAIVLGSALETWAERCKAFVQPSAMLQRLREGLDRKKRYLGLWVTRWLKRKAAAYRRGREAEELIALLLPGHSTQTPSDPGLRRAIVGAADAAWVGLDMPVEIANCTCAI